MAARSRNLTYSAELRQDISVDAGDLGRQRTRVTKTKSIEAQPVTNPALEGQPVAPFLRLWEFPRVRTPGRARVRPDRFGPILARNPPPAGPS